MKTYIIIALFCLICSCFPMDMGEMPPGIWERHVNEVQIAPNCIAVPLGKILLLRKREEYCAIKFTKAWTGDTEWDWYATYQSYYQGDLTGNFLNKNVQVKDGDVYILRRRGIAGRLSYIPGNKVKCGPLKLMWSYKSVIYFPNRPKEILFERDWDFELAPTTWDDISQVNVFDSRLKWYRYDERRKDVWIPIDQLWEDKKEK